MPAGQVSRRYSAKGLAELHNSELVICTREEVSSRYSAKGLAEHELLAPIQSTRFLVAIARKVLRNLVAYSVIAADEFLVAIGRKVLRNPP